MLCGCFVALRRGVFDRLGGVDEGYARYPDGRPAAEAAVTARYDAVARQLAAR